MVENLIILASYYSFSLMDDDILVLFSLIGLVGTLSRVSHHSFPTPLRLCLNFLQLSTHHSEQSKLFILYHSNPRHNKDSQRMTTAAMAYALFLLNSVDTLPYSTI